MTDLSTPIKKRRNAERTKAKILAVATKKFAYQGFAAVTVRDISTEVGITMPTLYHHFGNKEQLYLAVEDELYGRAVKRLRAVMTASPSPEETLNAFVETLYEIVNQDETFRRLIVRNLVDFTEQNQEFLVSTALQGVYEELRDAMNNYRSGSGDTVGPMAVFGAILGFVTLTPATHYLEGYCYATQNKEKESAEIVKLIMKLYQ